METWSRYLATWLGLLLSALLTILGPSQSYAVPATDRILERAIAQEDDWLVFQETGQRGCYLSQIAGDGATPMQLIVRNDGIPVLITPYRKGFKGYLILKVDRRSPLFVAASLVRNPQAFDVPKEMLRDMFAGKAFTVWAQPIDSDAQEQQFSLVGFTAAMSWLERAECRVLETPDDGTGGRETR